LELYSSNSDTLTHGRTVASAARQSPSSVRSVYVSGKPLKGTFRNACCEVVLHAPDVSAEPSTVRQDVLSGLWREINELAGQRPLLGGGLGGNGLGVGGSGLGGGGLGGSGAGGLGDCGLGLGLWLGGGGGLGLGGGGGLELGGGGGLGLGSGSGGGDG